MAKSETKNVQGQTNPQQSAQQQRGQQSVQNRGQAQGSGLARRGAYSPSLFSLGPRDVFSASPFELMRRFSEQMDRVFEDFGLSTQGTSRNLSAGTGQLTTWSPAIEVFQREGNLTIRAELPGLKKEDVKVHMTDDGLVIEGERKQEHEEKGEGFYRSERSYGQFYRLIPLPEEIDTEQVRAEFSNGVLEITVPVPERQQRRREIPIGAQGGEKAKSASAKG